MAAVRNTLPALSANDVTAISYTLIQPPGYAIIAGTFLAQEVNMPVVRSISMWFELLILVIGIAFGYLRKGKEDFWGLLKTGAIIGIVLAVIFGVIAFFFAPGDIGLGLGLVGGIGLFIGIILYVIIFLVGAFVGDWLEGMQKK